MKLEDIIANEKPEVVAKAKKISADTLLGKVEFAPKLADFLYNLI